MIKIIELETVETRQLMVDILNYLEEIKDEIADSVYHKLKDNKDVINYFKEISINTDLLDYGREETEILIKNIYELIEIEVESFVKSYFSEILNCEFDIVVLNIKCNNFIVKEKIIQNGKFIFNPIKDYLKEDIKGLENDIINSFIKTIE